MRMNDDGKTVAAMDLLVTGSAIIGGSHAKNVGVLLAAWLSVPFH